MIVTYRYVRSRDPGVMCGFVDDYAGEDGEMKKIQKKPITIEAEQSEEDVAEYVVKLISEINRLKKNQKTEVDQKVIETAMKWLRAPNGKMEEFTLFVEAVTNHPDWEGKRLYF